MTRHGARGTRYTGAYRDPDGATRSAGSFSTRREALRAANREEQKVLAGAWHDSTHGDITFRAYVEKEWLSNKHVEASTRAAYISYLDKHFYPFFGHRRLNKISPRWWAAPATRPWGVPMSWPIITDQASATTPKPRRCYSSRN